jgi:hypothetical protein
VAHYTTFKLLSSSPEEKKDFSTLAHFNPRKFSHRDAPSHNIYNDLQNLMGHPPSKHYAEQFKRLSFIPELC